MKKKLCLTFLALVSVAPALHAQTADFSGMGQSRYFSVGEVKEAVQYNITLKGSIDIGGTVTIHSMAQTGGKYFAGFNDLYDLRNEDFSEEHRLYLKRLYLEKDLMNSRLKLQAGAMGTRPSLAQANKLADIGWIDGARARARTSVGNMVVTAGQIKEEPNITGRARDYELNYFEVSFSSEVLEKLLAEGGVEVYKGEAYLQMATHYEVEAIAGRILKLVGEGKLQLANGGYKVAGGAQDLVTSFRGRKSSVRVDVNYEYVHADFNQEMMRLYNPLHNGQKGGAVVLKSLFPVSKNKELSVFLNTRIASKKENLFFEIGIRKKFNLKKNRKNRRIK